MAVIVQIRRAWLPPLRTGVFNNEPIKEALSPETIVGSDVFITLQSRRDAEDLRRIAEEYCPGAVHEIDLSLHLHDLYVKYGVND